MKAFPKATANQEAALRSALDGRDSHGVTLYEIDGKAIFPILDNDKGLYSMVFYLHAMQDGKHLMIATALPLDATPEQIREAAREALTKFMSYLRACKVT